jgi:hypothetical protein
MDDLSYRLLDDGVGVLLNPSDNTIPAWVDITKVTGLDSAPFRESQRDHEGVDGSFMDAEFEQGRSLVLEGMAYCNDGTQVEAFLDDLKWNWAPQSNLVNFYYKAPGVSERLLRVKPLGIRYDVETLRNTGCTNIQFQAFAEDPRIYNSDLINVNLSQGVAVVSGIGFPLGFPFGFGDVASPESSNVQNLGNRPTPATITIPGPVTNPRIYNDTTGDQLSFNITLTATDTLVIDLYYKTVRLNGTANRRATLSSPGWFLLQVGDNFLRYRADTSGNPPAVVSYRYAWR